MNTTQTRHTIWLLSPYHTGSHRAWAEGYQRHSRHRVDLLTMAGRFWKWRMQGGAVELAEQARRRLEHEAPPDAILVTDMLNLPTWLGLARRRLPSSIPILLYMHENQLTYPWRSGETPDLTYGMLNWLSQLAADRILFNSRFHLQSWFDALSQMLKHFPDYNHLAQIEAVVARSVALPVGIDLPAPVERESRIPATAPLILWNQRWEYDKRPDRFFALLYRLHESGVDFRLAVAGESFRNSPQEFNEARQRLADHIVHWGFLPSKDEYTRLLGEADLVISTTDHEFFGISVLEAIAAGVFPLLPNRLSYPELIPAELHPACIYEDEDDLYVKAVQRLRFPRSAPSSLRNYIAANFSWPVVAERYDAVMEDVVHNS
jgi:glycosyltransferase involved in cell wall biosynthesis